MTHMFNKPTTTSSSGALGMHRDSRVISKVQPKIRIIHIFAPEIIKTDVANFRELVQRLTGKPMNDAGCKGKGKDKSKGKKVKVDAVTAGVKSHHINTKLEVMMRSGSSSSPSSSSDHHTSSQGWRSTAGDHNTTSGGYLTGFNDDLDYNFDFNTMFQLGAADGSSHDLNSLGESQLSYRG